MNPHRALVQEIAADPIARQYVELVTDPFDQTTSGAEGGWAIPDGRGGFTVGLKSTGRTTFASTSGARLLIQMLNVYPGTSMTRINHSVAGGASPTGNTDVTREQDASHKLLASKYRLVAAGLRVRNLDPEATATGSAWAGQSPNACMTGAGTWNTYATMLAAGWAQGQNGKSYFLGADRGLTVRWVPQTNQANEFHGQAADGYTAATAAEFG